MDRILIRFGELWLKSKPVRSRFEKKLIRNLHSRLRSAGIRFKIKREFNRLFILTNQLKPACSVIKKTFGVSSFSPVRSCDANIASIFSTVKQTIKLKKYQTFAVLVKRIGEHPFTSKKLEEELGKLIKEKFKANVNLTNPEKKIWVEVREERAYVFTKKIQGAGGLPLSASGKIIVLLADTNSALAAWLLMKRGCEIIPLHANIGLCRQDRVNELLKWLSEWSSELHMLEFPLYEALKRFNRFPTLRCALCKRFMYMVANKAANRLGASAIVTGETYLENLALLNEASALPVYKPLLGFEKKEINRLAKKIQIPDVQIICKARSRRVLSLEEVKRAETDIDRLLAKIKISTL